MRVIDSGLMAPYVVEARRQAFEDFLRGKANAGYQGSGMRDVALHNYGFCDSFGPVEYKKGMHNGKWIMPDGGENGSVLLFRSRQEALDYGKSLLGLFPKYGYFHCKILVDAVVVYMSFPTGFIGSLANSEMYEDKNYHVLRIRIRK